MCECRVVWKCDGKRKKCIKKNIIFVFPWKQKALRERERERALFKENMLTILGKAEFPGEDSPSLSEI